MGTGMARVMLTTAMAAFFAGLALDIAVPAVVLSMMAASNWLVQCWPEPRPESRMASAWLLQYRKGRPA